MGRTFPGARALVAALVASACASGSGDPLTVIQPEPGITVHESRRHYTVRGSTGREISASLEENAPRRHGHPAYGLTNWSLSWRFSLRRTAGACRPADPRVRAEIEIVLPRWRGEAEAGGVLAFEWGKFRRDVVEHEAEHRRLVLEAAREIMERIGRVRGLTCDLARRRADRAAEEIVAEYERRHRRFDRESAGKIDPEVGDR
jgi:predicted secreted Zn-dependent protease